VPKYTSKTPAIAIASDTFDCGKPEHAATFVKHKKIFIEYIRREFPKEPILIAEALETGVAPAIVIPGIPAMIENPNNMGQVPPDMIVDQAATYLWQGTMKLIPSRQQNLSEGLITVFSLALDQCTPTLKSKLEQLATWPQIAQTKDPLQLFDEIRNIVCGRESHHQEPYFTMAQMIMGLVTFRQGHMTNEKYKETFDALWETHKQQGGNIAHHPGLIASVAERLADAANRPAADRPHPDDTAMAKAYVEERMKACFMLLGAQKSRHNDLKLYLENSFTMGRDEFPLNTTELLSLLNNFRPDESKPPPANDRHNRDRDRNRPGLPPEEGVNFAQSQGTDETAAEEGVQMFIFEDTSNEVDESPAPPSYADAARSAIKPPATPPRGILKSSKSAKPKSNVAGTAGVCAAAAERLICCQLGHVPGHHRQAAG
jgi:hypothetical protein